MAQLDKNRINFLLKYINKNLKIEDELKKEKFNIFQNLLEIKSYKGIRHTYGLPTNGQRTHTNRKTAKKLKNKWIK